MNENELRSNLSENIAKLRRNAGLTQSALGEKLGYSDKSISKWERGEGLPDICVLCNMAELFGVSTDTLLLKKADEEILPLKRKIRVLTVLLSVALVWLTAVSVYFLLRLAVPAARYSWLCFIFAVPISFIITLVFSYKWKKLLFQCLSVTGIIWGTAVSLQLVALFTLKEGGTWLIYVIAGVLEIMCIMWFILRMRKQR